MEENITENSINSPYICIKSLEKGVSVIGMTRGENTKFHHTEKLDEGEVLIVQFTENTSAIKIRGLAEIYTQFGLIKSNSFTKSNEVINV